MTDPTGVQSKTVLDANGNTASVATGITATKPTGDVTTYSYTDADELETVDPPGPGDTSYTYWASGERHTYTHPYSNELDATWTYTYDAFGRLKTDEDPDARVTSYGYDAAGRLATVQQATVGADCGASPKVGCVTYGYDDAGRPTSVDYSDSNTPDVTGITYDDLGRRIAATASGVTEEWHWNDRSQLASVKDGNGRTTSYVFDPTGNLTHITYPGQTNPVVREFDDAGRLKKVTDWSGRETSFGYNDDSQWNLTTFPGSVNTDTYGFDQAGRMTSVAWNKGATVLGSETYTRPTNTKGMIEDLTPTGAAGSTVKSHGYDTRDRLTTAGTEGFGYDPAGNLTETSDGRLQVFDPAQQLCWTSPTATTGTCTTPASDATTYSYDALGNRTGKTTPGGNQSAYEYDQANRLTTVTVPDAGIQSSGQYKGLTGGASRVADSTNVTTPGTCSGSACARLSANDSVTVQVTGVGNMPSSGAIAVSGTITAINPGANGTVKVNPNGVASAARLDYLSGDTTAGTFIAELDSNGRITVSTTAATDIAVDITGYYTEASLAPSSNYWPTDATRIASTTAHTGTCDGGTCNRLTASQTVTIDAAGVGDIPTDATAVVAAVTAISPGANGLLRVSPSGDASAGSVTYTSGWPASAVITAPIDANGRITISTTAATDVVVDVSGWYAPPTSNDTGTAMALMDAPTRIVDTTDGTGICDGDPCDTFSTSPVAVAIAGQDDVPDTITAAVVNVTVLSPASNGWITADYNATGGAAAGFAVFTAGNDQSFTAVLPVAEDGTVTLQTTSAVDLTLDVIGTFARPVDTYHYTYDSSGLRTSKAADGGATEFTWDQSGGLPLLIEQTTGTTTSYLIYGPGGLPIYQIRADGSVLYFHHDQLGSTRLLTNSSGNSYGTMTYGAYGQTLTDTTPWYLERPLLGYNAQYTDTETNLTYLRARYYDPTTGQFMTMDPLVASTQEAYGYAGNNPINGTDPLGLFGLPFKVPEWVPFAGGADCVAIADPNCDNSQTKENVGQFMAGAANTLTVGHGEQALDVTAKILPVGTNHPNDYVDKSSSYYQGGTDFGTAVTATIALLDPALLRNVIAPIKVTNLVGACTFGSSCGSTFMSELPGFAAMGVSQWAPWGWMQRVAPFGPIFLTWLKASTSAAAAAGC